MSSPTAVVLFNLGGPDALTAVEPFLYNLFRDPAIFRLPLARLTQRPLARWIARRRAPAARAAYAAIGGRSPLLEHTRRQAEALARALAPHGAFEVEICMRYWHPLTAATVERLKARGIERCVLLPLYPQYSDTTTGSSYDEFRRECMRQNYQPRMRLIRHWYDDPDYQQAVAEGIGAAAARLPDPDPARIELLFSAHGLPQKLVAAGDPYRREIEATYEALRARLGFPRTTLCYQSRVGPLEWLRPYTEDTIREKAAAGCRQMLVYPIAFVSDHVETLYELGMVYAELARAAGIAHYHVVPALNDHPLLIRALARRTLEAAAAL
jgi:ferrochelatase